LGAEWVVTRGDGYLLRGVELDAACFERLLARGREALAAERMPDAAGLFGEALGLWRGPLLADVVLGEWLAAEAARLEELRLVAVEERLAADLALGRHAEVVGELRGLVSEQRLRERCWALLMLALYRCGRQAEALAAYRQARELLVGELGIEPGSELRALERKVLEQDPSLDAPVAPRAPAVLAAPTPVTPLVGRVRERERLAGLLASDDVRLVTLTGPGGIGKTRLALAALNDQADTFADGVAAVFLADVRDSTLLAPSMLAALAVRADPAKPTLEQLGAYLRERQLLILIDNFEQLLPAAPQLSQLLGRAPNLKLLTTSRVRLRISGEHELNVGPLAPEDAISLFTARARAANTTFELSPTAAKDVAIVCERLDRMPLALELAAARLRLLTPSELAKRLDERLAYLTGGSPDAPQRHQTLRATLDWSYELLPPTARQLLAALSIFQGGFTLNAAHTVCAPDEASETNLLDAIGLLVDHSLLHRSQDPDHPDHDARFRMLETIREYAAEQLTTTTTTDQLAARHANHYLHLAEQANPALGTPDAASWFARLQAELGNLRAALNWALPDTNPQLGLRLAATLGQRFWGIACRFEEGVRWLELALASAPQRSASYAEALTSLAVLLLGSNPEDSLSAADRALALAEDVDPEDGRLIMWCTFVRARATYQCGNHELADRRNQEAARLAAALGDREIAQVATASRANIALGAADYERAVSLCTAALADSEIASPRVKDNVMCVLSVASAHLGDTEQAVRAIREALNLAQEINTPGASCGVLRAAGVVTARFGSAERAARLMGHERMLREGVGVVIDPTDRRELAGALKTLQAKLYPEVLASAEARGREMTLAEAFGEVLTELGDLSGS
jgi:predicted ATPase/DNA-binding SARP family transcriptional activator